MSCWNIDSIVLSFARRSIQVRVPTSVLKFVMVVRKLVHGSGRGGQHRMTCATSTFKVQAFSREKVLK